MGMMVLIDRAGFRTEPGKRLPETGSLEFVDKPLNALVAHFFPSLIRKQSLRLELGPTLPPAPGHWGHQCALWLGD